MSGGSQSILIESTNWITHIFLKEDIEMMEAGLCLGTLSISHGKSALIIVFPENVEFFPVEKEQATGHK